jgi:hypothetical protein
MTRKHVSSGKGFFFFVVAVAVAVASMESNFKKFL